MTQDDDAIRYTTIVADLASEQLDGFFVGWPQPPSPATHLQMLRGATHAIVALDGVRVVGFITALSDGVLSAYIPLLEVLPSYRGRGIGGELVRRMLARLDGHYMIDVVCDADVQPFYERAGLRRAHAMVARNYARQSGGVPSAGAS